MLNIISRSYVSKHNRGPRKVVLNLIKGLDEIKYPYVINASLDATKVIWIHDDKEALEEVTKLSTDIAIIAGPNIYTLPSEIPSTIDTSRIIWIHPAKWVKAFWEQSMTTQIESIVCPVGIDTKVFHPDSINKKEIILVYNKQRSDEEVSIVCRALEAHGEKYKVITYGNYNEEDYKKLLGESKALIWIGRSESQGIGLLEALATDVPTLVWDIEKFGEWSGSGHERFTKEQLDFTSATAAPYFDNSCGIVFNEKDELDTSLSHFLTNLKTFTPRSYIEINLPLGKQANEFISIYKEHFKVTDLELKDTTLANRTKWKNASWCFYITTRFKDAIRQIIS